MEKRSIRLKAIPKKVRKPNDKLRKTIPFLDSLYEELRKRMCAGSF